MLKIEDLVESKALDAQAMSTVVGGCVKPRRPKIDLDFSNRLTNKVADVDQMFSLGLSQENAGLVENNQALEGGNGPLSAGVDQHMDQDNRMRVHGLGNTRIS